MMTSFNFILYTSNANAHNEVYFYPWTSVMNFLMNSIPPKSKKNPPHIEFEQTKKFIHVSRPMNIALTIVFVQSEASQFKKWDPKYGGAHGKNRLSKEKLAAIMLIDMKPR